MAPKNGTVQEKKFFSKELNEEMTLLVYLPSNYSPLYKYHVIIAQDSTSYRASRLLIQFLIVH